MGTIAAGGMTPTTNVTMGAGGFGKSVTEVALTSTPLGEIPPAAIPIMPPWETPPPPLTNTATLPLGDTEPLGGDTATP